MREIKFRAKSGTQWRYGDLYHNECGDTMIYESQTVNGWRIKVDPETVGQFTGLYDCSRSDIYPKGRPIYEGDILHVLCENPHWGTHRNYVVEWCEDGWILDGDPLSRWFKLYDLKVIGNVYDNPDLLEKQP